MIVKTILLSVGPKSIQEGVRLMLDFFRLDSLRRNYGETVRHWTCRFTLLYSKVGQALHASNAEINKDFLHEVFCWLRRQSVHLRTLRRACSWVKTARVRGTGTSTFWCVWGGVRGERVVVLVVLVVLVRTLCMPCVSIHACQRAWTK